MLHALSGGDVHIKQESPDGLHVRGGASDHVLYLIDNVPVLSPFHAAGTLSAFNPDAIARAELYAATPPPSFPDALTGAIAATTRSGSIQHESQGSLGTTEARLTMSGPGLRAESGYLLSARSTFPGYLAKSHESSYLHNESGDWLGKIESPLYGGRLHLLLYSNENEISTAPDTGVVSAQRNGLEWSSRSLGGEWRRALAGSSERAVLVLRAWTALADARARWRTLDTTDVRLTSTRRDLALLLMLQLPDAAAGGTAVGLRAERLRTRYAAIASSRLAASATYAMATALVTPFISHERTLRSRTTLDLALSAPIATSGLQLSPRVRVRHTPSAAVAITATYSRLQQFVQSLRNPESVVSNIFPMDLYVTADGESIPTAWSDQGSVGVEYHASPAARVEAHVYQRRFGGVALVAPRDSGPFATSGLAHGVGNSRGIAVDASAHGSRLGLLASYNMQQVRFRHGDSSYVPGHAARHALEAGVVAFPSATISLKLSVTTEMGRRATAVNGPFEWEACNLRDRGCEFAGSPVASPSAIGAIRLPQYVRVDAAVRKHWHVRLAQRDGIVGLFAGAANILDRKNVLTFSIDPVSGRRSGVEMRPAAPLVLGMDWRY
jgi:hypothetical protein